jgi:hypothetical protein
MESPSSGSQITARFVTFVDGSFGKLDAKMSKEGLQLNVFHVGTNVTFSGELLAHGQLSVARAFETVEKGSVIFRVEESRVMVELFEGLLVVPLERTQQTMAATVVIVEEAPLEVSFPTVKNFGGKHVLTRQSENQDYIHWKSLSISLNPGLRNNPETVSLYCSGWRQYIAADVTPRDIIRFVGLDESAQVELYHPDNVVSALEKDQEWINLTPKGPPIPKDEPIFSHYADYISIFATILGELHYLEEEEESEESSSASDNDEADCFIYILKCASGKYYVGRTQNPDFRLQNHFDGEGSAWTRRYEPRKVVEIFQSRGLFDETSTTLELMSAYGVDNVRGGLYCQMKLSRDDQVAIEKQMRSAHDECMTCGGDNHFASDCPQKKTKERRYTTKRSKEPDPTECKRCGRSSHTASQCYAKTILPGFKPKKYRR